MKSVLTKIKYSSINHDGHVNRESFLLFIFLVRNIFLFNNNWLNDFKNEILPDLHIDDSDLELVKFATTCEEFITFFRRYCNCSEDVIDKVAFLLRIFFERYAANNIAIKYSWIARQMLYDSPKINSGIKSIRAKLKTSEEHTQLREIVLKIGGLENLAVSLKGSHRRIGEQTWINYDEKCVLRAMVRTLYSQNILKMVI